MHDSGTTVLNHADYIVGPQRNRWRLYLAGLFAAAAIVLLGLWYAEHMRTERIKQQLIGKWTETVRSSNGMISTYVWEFRSDGSVSDYPIVGKPTRIPYPTQDFMQWEIEGDELVFNWDHHFTRNATIGRRLGQVGTFLMNLWQGSDVPLKYEDRCTFQGEIGETLMLVLDPEVSEAEAYMPRRVTLTRAPHEQQ